jgi:hypothetical protein
MTMTNGGFLMLGCVLAPYAWGYMLAAIPALAAVAQMNAFMGGDLSSLGIPYVAMLVAITLTCGAFLITLGGYVLGFAIYWCGQIINSK